MQLAKSGVVETILSFAKFKQDQLLKKTDGNAKMSRISGISKLDDANNAGTRNGRKCTLILTEGDSAKSLAVSGLAVVGRDNFGVFPLRGKLLNVREATHSQITGNAEINAIKQILGLQHGKTYETIDQLRYGHLMIMTDQDHDGSHIKGLIINFLDHFWPSLLKIPGFLLEFITPIVKATKGSNNRKQEIAFFTIPEYEAWLKENNEGKGWTIKYFKGLGTSTTADAKQYFSDMGKHLKPFKASDDDARALIDMAFSKQKVDSRKEWLRRFQPGTFIDHNVEEISLSDFINRELILFSIADCVRSIPSSIDGFKPGQRKILFSCFKRNLHTEIKVAQLAGYVAEHSAYHHGEQSLTATIVGMAQNYIGSNNLALLMPNGQFGTRLQGGKDAASARYIFTNLSPLARVVFPASDDPLLKSLVDDGQRIEPEYYVPVLPMLLVNGSEGIGTGWSSSIPTYNPRDLVECLRLLTNDNEAVLPELHPWYRGFTGTIEKIAQDRYRVTGCIRKIDSTTVEITELPIAVWTQTYKEQLEEWLAGTDKRASWIKSFREYHTDSKVHFIVTLTEQAMLEAEQEGLEKRFKLVGSISTSNLVCFDSENRIKKYETVQEIIREFFAVRREFYRKRKDYMLDQLTFEYERLDSKVRFVTEIINGTLVVQNRKRSELLVELAARKFKSIPKKSTGAIVSGDVSANADADDEPADESVYHGFDYLLSMPIWNLTLEKVEQLRREMRDKEQEIKILVDRTIDDLWRTDLDAFLAHWDKYESDLEKADSQRPDNAITAMSGKGKKNAAGSRKAVNAIAKKAKQVRAGGDSDDDMGSDDDFEIKPKAKGRPKSPAAIAKAAATAAAVTKPAAPVRDIKLESEPSSSSAVVGKSKLAAPTKRMQTDTTDEAHDLFAGDDYDDELSGALSPPAAKRRFVGTKKSAVPPANAMKQIGKQAAASSTAIAIGDDSDEMPALSKASASTSSKPRLASAASAAKSKAVISLDDDDDDEDDDDLVGGKQKTETLSEQTSKPAVIVKPKAIAKKQPKPKQEDSDQDTDDHPAAVSRKSAASGSTAPASRKPSAAATKKSGVTKKTAAPPKPRANKKKAVISDDDDDEEEAVISDDDDDDDTADDSAEVKPASRDRPAARSRTVKSYRIPASDEDDDSDYE
eukprot:jgi/Hompol1/7001/HPOL_005154-RA